MIKYVPATQAPEEGLRFLRVIMGAVRPFFMHAPQIALGTSGTLPPEGA